MSRDEIDAKLRELFSMLFDLPEADIGPDFSPDSCTKWDSLAHVKLVSAIEEGFGLTLSPEEQFEMLSFELVGDVLADRVG